MVKRSKSAKRRRSTKKKSSSRPSATKLGSSSSYKFKIQDLVIYGQPDFEKSTQEFMWQGIPYAGIQVKYDVAKLLKAGDFVNGLRAQASLWQQWLLVNVKMKNHVTLSNTSTDFRGNISMYQDNDNVLPMGGSISAVINQPSCQNRIYLQDKQNVFYNRWYCSATKAQKWNSFKFTENNNAVSLSIPFDQDLQPCFMLCAFAQKNAWASMTAVQVVTTFELECRFRYPCIGPNTISYNPVSPTDNKRVVEQKVTPEQTNQAINLDSKVVPPFVEIIQQPTITIEQNPEFTLRNLKEYAGTQAQGAAAYGIVKLGGLKGRPAIRELFQFAKMLDCSNVPIANNLYDMLCQAPCACSFSIVDSDTGEVYPNDEVWFNKESYSVYPQLTCSGCSKYNRGTTGLYQKQISANELRQGQVVQNCSNNYLEYMYYYLFSDRFDVQQMHPPFFARPGLALMFRAIAPSVPNKQVKMWLNLMQDTAMAGKGWRQWWKDFWAWFVNKLVPVITIITTTLLYDDGSKVLGESDYIIENDVYYWDGIAPANSPFYDQTIYGSFTEVQYLYDGTQLFSMVDGMQYSRNDVFTPTFYGAITDLQYSEQNLNQVKSLTDGQIEPTTADLRELWNDDAQILHHSPIQLKE